LRYFDSIAGFTVINYDGLYKENPVFNFFLQPYVPFVAVLLYMTLSKTVMQGMVSTFSISPKSPTLKAFITVHSGLLAVYSCWTFVNVANILFKFYTEHGFWNMICADKKGLWDDYNMKFWITHFYISKFYEFVDTWIVYLKGREPIVLQTYHHAGIVICMWALTVTHCSQVIVIVALNSLIHTLMYTYYTAAAVGYSSPLKHYLTQMQIIQFLCGLAITVPTHWFKKTLDGKYHNNLYDTSSYLSWHMNLGRPVLNPSQNLALWTVEWYAILLIVLFAEFYTSNYSAKKTKKAE